MSTQNFKKISLEEAEQIINKSKVIFKSEILDELQSVSDIAEKILLYRGDYSAENLKIGEDIILIDGNLNIENIIEDCDGVDVSLLIVLGDVKCKNLITLSGMHIVGDLIVENAVLGDSLCDLSLNVGGNITSKIILEYGHCINCEQKITTEHVFSFNVVADEDGNIMPTISTGDLLEELVTTDEDGSIEDLSKTINYIRNGGTVFVK